MLRILKLVTIITTTIMFLSGVAMAESKLISQWYASEYSQARAHILAATDQKIQLAVEIKIIENYKTYWKSPGSTGVPPLVTISGNNIAADSPQIFFPQPHKYIDKYGETWGYKDGVVLFVNVNRQAANVQTQVDFLFDYAVCDVICLPEHAEFKLELEANNLAPTMASLKFKKYSRQIAKPVTLDNSPIDNAQLNAKGQLVLALNRPLKGDVFITDSKNRFYQYASSNAAQHIYNLHGMAVTDNYNQLGVQILYAEDESHYNLSLKPE